MRYNQRILNTVRVDKIYLLKSPSSTRFVCMCTKCMCALIGVMTPPITCCAVERMYC